MNRKLLSIISKTLSRGIFQKSKRKITLKKKPGRKLKKTPIMLPSEPEEPRITGSRQTEHSTEPLELSGKLTQ